MLAALPRLIGGLWLLLRLAVGYALVLKAPMPASVRRWLRGVVERRGAAALVRHIRRHGALLIKIGQYLGSRPDIIPAAYADACAGLRDQAPARPWAVVAPVVAAAWAGRADAPVLEPAAIAAASIGQVHRGRMPDGSAVAVKIQYPGLERAVAADLVVLRLALRLLRLALPGWPLERIADEVAMISRREMDYRLEAEAAERLRDPLGRIGLRVPAVLAEWSGPKVLTMAFAPGASLARTDLTAIAPAERERVAKLLVKGFLAQLLDLGLFHADPHGGNLLYDPERRELWLLDFGMVAEVTEDEAAAYRRFLLALARRDPDALVAAVLDLGFVMPEADLPELRRLAREALGAIGDKPPAEVLASARGQAVAEAMDRFLRNLRGVVLPRNTVLLSRATGLLEGVCVSLVPDRNLIALARPELTRLVLRQPVDELHWQWRRFRRRVERWWDLPERVDRLVAVPPAPVRAAAPWPWIAAAVLLVAAAWAPDPTGRLLCATGAAIALAVAVVRR